MNLLDSYVFVHTPEFLLLVDWDRGASCSILLNALRYMPCHPHCVAFGRMKCKVVDVTVWFAY